jgi:hypothetical protein
VKGWKVGLIVVAAVVILGVGGYAISQKSALPAGSPGTTTIPVNGATAAIQQGAQTAQAAAQAAAQTAAAVQAVTAAAQASAAAISALGGGGSSDDTDSGDDTGDDSD